MTNITSPNMGVNDGIVTSAKSFSDNLTLELTDSEIKRAFEIIMDVKNRWQGTFRSKLRHANFTVEDAMKLVDDMEGELVDRLANELQLIATVDAAPVFHGEPPIIELVGALPGHSVAKYGLDHEKKEWEVKRSKDQGEDFLGSKNLDI